MPKVPSFRQHFQESTVYRIDSLIVLLKLFQRTGKTSSPLVHFDSKAQTLWGYRAVPIFRSQTENLSD